MFKSKIKDYQASLKTIQKLIVERKKIQRKNLSLQTKADVAAAVVDQTTKDQFYVRIIPLRLQN